MSEIGCWDSEVDVLKECATCGYGKDKCTIHAEVEKLKRMLVKALPTLEHNAPQPYPGHRCGDPNSACDTHCMEVAMESELISEIHAVLKEDGDAN